MGIDIRVATNVHNGVNTDEPCSEANALTTGELGLAGSPTAGAAFMDVGMVARGEELWQYGFGLRILGPARAPADGKRYSRKMLA
jgi:hypothetical protein